MLKEKPLQVFKESQTEASTGWDIDDQHASTKWITINTFKTRIISFLFFKQQKEESSTNERVEAKLWQEQLTEGIIDIGNQTNTSKTQTIGMVIESNN